MEINSLTYENVQRILPDRDPYAHKGDFGRVLLLCGSRGYTGAAALAAMGALRSGSGLVYLGVPECIYTIEAVKMNEAIVLPLPDMNGKFSFNAIEDIRKMLPNMDAVLIGPGIGCCKETEMIVCDILQNYDGPVVLDADGINVLCGHMDILRGRTCPTVMTPHLGEFRRFAGDKGENAVNSAVNLAKQTGAVIVLKGHETVITDGQRVFVNHTGNPGMAVGGSGDVLAGMIVSLIGQGIPVLKAAAAAVWLHGAAGDQCAERIGQYGMLPTDMLCELPRLMK